MSFPTSPSNMDRYNNYVYDSTKGAWVKLSEIITPSFMSFGAAGDGSFVQPWIFDEVYTNVGGHYSTTTGYFTAPFDGVYQFSWGTIGSVTELTHRYYFYVNDGKIDDFHLRLEGVGSGSGYLSNSSITIQYPLDKGDTVSIGYTAGGATSFTGSQYPQFNGHFVS